MPIRLPHILLALLALCLAATAAAPRAEAIPIQPGFSESVVFDGLTEPSDMVFAPDGRIFVAEKSGLIKAYANLNAATPTIAADLRTQVYNFWDRGLLGIALDPQFPARPYMYAMYAVDAVIGGTPPRWGQPGVTSDPCPTPPGPTEDGCVVSTRLSKLTLSGSSVVSEQVLINDWCQQYPSHSAGSLVFGPDGKLYASGGEGASFTFVDYGQAGQPRNPCGDPSVPVGANQTPPTAEGGALRAQDLLTPLDPANLGGTIIRIDPDTGAGAPGNPLAASADPNARRIVAMGMRNPFRFAFRPGTSEIYLGDVGWSSWEEINRIPRADDSTVDNFGWPCYEGDGSKQSGYQNAGLNLCEQLYDNPGSVSQPLFAYSHSGPVVAGENCAGGGSSTSGLAFYQGGNYPASYADALFFADYSRRCVWVMFKRNGEPDPSTRARFLRSVEPVNLEIGPGGDLFVVDFAGSIRRIAYPGGNRAPTAVATADPGSGPLPLTVQFDGLGSSDPDDGDSLEYDWDLDGDGQFDDSTHPRPTWTYTTAATVTARLRVTDEGGLTATDAVTIGAGNDSPDAQIDTPATGFRWAVGDEISFSGHASDAQDGALGPQSMTWNVVLNHCVTVDDCHAHPVQTYEDVASGEFVAPDHDYPSHLELRLTVTDSGGLSDTATLRLDPRTVDLTFQSNPAGLRLSVGSTDGVTPFTRTAIVGSRNTIAGATPQLSGGVWQRFVSWSDGGARSHEITAPPTAATYTATYEPEATIPGLVLGLGFDEATGTAAVDSSTAGNQGVLNGATRVAGGRFGRALSFDGLDDRVDVADSASLDLTTGMTLEAWVRPTSVTGWRTGIVKERGTGGHVYALYPSNGTTPVAENYLFGNYNVAPWGPALPVNAWSHIASTYDGELLRLYVNGEQVAATPAAGAMAATTNPLRIGGHSAWGEHFAGLIDEVRVYDRALSAANIAADMNTPITAVAPPDTVAPSAPSNLQATGSLGQVSLSWGASTDNVAVTGYEVYRSTTAGFTPAAGNRIATVSASSGTSYVDTVAAGTYHYRVKAIDAASNLSAASNEASGVAAADTTGPSVSVTSPTAGTVSGAVTLRATASDNVGVSGVQFLVDGNAFGAEDTTAPYEIQWPSGSVANGGHQISARARDVAGNTTTSAPVAVTVSNTPASSGLVLGLGFDETSGTAATDSSPAGNPGVVNGATRVADGRFGRGLSFDGVNDRVDVADSASLDLTNGMTLEAWVRPTSVSGWRTGIVKERGTDGHAYALYPSNGTTPVAENYVLSTYRSAPGASALPVNAWTHLASTYDGAMLRLFVNGTQVSATPVTGAMAASTNPLRIGGHSVWGEYFAGLIDEVRVYNRALSAAEIGADMNAPITAVAPSDTVAPSAPSSLQATGSLGQVSLSWGASTDNVAVTGYEVYRSTTAGFTPGAGNRIAVVGSGTSYVDTVAAGTYRYKVRAVDAAGNLSASSNEAAGTATADTTGPTVSLTSPAAGTVSGAVTLRATASDNVGVAGVQFLVDGNAFGVEDTAAPYEIQWPSGSVANGSHQISARARDAAGNTTTSAPVAVTVSNTPASTGLVLGLGFNETSGTAATDSSGTGNAGVVNGATRVADGRFGRGLSFDGVNDRVDVADSASLDLTSGMTLEAWVRPTSVSGWRTGIVKERGTGGHVYALYASDGAAPITENYVLSTYRGAPGASALPLNTWTHLASTYDGAMLRLFVNGSQVSATPVSGAMAATTNPLRIGGHAAWGEYFAGLIDEVRVYNRALSAAEIGADMSNPIAP